MVTLSACEQNSFVPPPPPKVEVATPLQRPVTRYLEATGLTPGRAVERLRVEAARQLLSDSRLPVKRIARRCGFGSEETMRRSFVRHLGTTPQAYRDRFSPAEAS